MDNIKIIGILICDNISNANDPKCSICDLNCKTC